MRVLGWTLLHFVWQGALLGLLYALARKVLPRGEARYRFGMAILAAFALCPLLTLWRLLTASPPVTQMAVDLVTPALSGHGAAVDATPWAWGASLNALLPWLVLVWSLGVLLLSLRAWRQWRGVKALVRMAELMPEWQHRVSAMSARFGLRRRVVVLCSKVIATPAVVGWIRPVILLPMAVACNLPAAQIELILAHELAHLRRWDPLANLLQIVLETLYFYHPVVHWVSRDVRNEREICCDELALAVNGGSRHEFVTALVELGELRERHTSLLLAASGGVLLDRVQHMVMPVREGMSVRTPARFVALLLGALLLTLTLQIEWQHSHVQQDLKGAILRLQSILALQQVPLARPVANWYAADLAPKHAEAQRPVENIALMPAEADARAALPIAQVALTLPRVASQGVVDLVPIRHDELITSVAVQGIPDEPSSGSAPIPLHISQPVYPRAALLRGVEGQVVIEFRLSADGGVVEPRVVSAEPAGVFDQAAVAAIRTWRYAVPEAGAGPRKYHQAVAFTLTAGGLASGQQTEDGADAKVNCRVPTGTHICRGL
ncbi:M56 family metallopeptidase [Rhodanobacter sp. B04]|uniref:M56 family metallopeptidase n=1 Tax=Rhodanobacter sp. B04 TaxID=1945860 RepID=UPI00143BAC6B|nr:M56 family metallopeptidase [Rhodanobacter sp. B04]